VDVEEVVAVRCEVRLVAVAYKDGLGAGGECLNEHLDRCGALEVGRVGGFTVGSGFRAVGVGDGGGVRSPSELGDVLRIVLGVVGELSGVLIGSRDPEIVAAFCILYPGEEIALRCGGERGGIGRAENLLQRKRLRIRRALGGRGQ
jgi:hypothetical protein